MATFTEATIQQTKNEIRKWTVDFTNDLPAGITVSSGTAVHTPPSGTASTPTVTAASPYVTAQIGPLAVTGIHYLDVQATFSNGEKSEQRIAFAVNYQATTAREGMLDLIQQVRGMCDIGPDEYEIAGVQWWNDAQIQTVMDKHRIDVTREALDSAASYSDMGVYQTLEYKSDYRFFESGTAYFRVQSGAFVTEGTAGYTADYNNGIVTFNADTGGSVMYLTARAYNLDAAAVEIWRMKAANAARMYDFATDNHDMKRSQYMAHCQSMVKYYQAQMGVGSGELLRSDLNA